MMLSLVADFRQSLAYFLVKAQMPPAKSNTPTTTIMTITLPPPPSLSSRVLKSLELEGIA